MLKSGNSNPEVCAQNLVKITRGECAVAVGKGIDGELIDQNNEGIAPLLRQDARKMIEEYEPRIQVNRVQVIKDFDRDQILIEISKGKEKG